MTTEKEPKEKLWTVAFQEVIRIGSGKPASMVVLTEICDRIIAGEREETAIGLISIHGTINMMMSIHAVGAVEAKHWTKWKDSMTVRDAETILSRQEEFPHEVREWAMVLVVSQQ